MSLTHYNYSSAEVDDTAKEIIQTLCDLDVPNRLALVALCKAIVMISTEEDLDYACKIIDDFAEKGDENV